MGRASVEDMADGCAGLLVIEGFSHLGSGRITRRSVVRCD